MINIVIGKPGSGKTYHMVRYLYEVLTELIKKSQIERKIYTNISVNVEEFNRQLSKAFKQKIDVSGLLVLLDGDDLKYDPSQVSIDDRIEKRVAGRSFYSVAATSKAFFWNRFDDNALILIDEIQKYLSTVKEESDSEKQSLIEYFSLHRHRRHDWYFITQNLMSLPVEIRRVSEKVYNIFNAKSMSLGFPINIPLRDVEILLAGFNISRQVYRVREGYLESSFRVTYEDSVEVVVMEKRVFALYQTHTQMSDNSSANMFRGDSTLPFDLGPGQRRRAVLWFLKKHGFHLSLKVFAVVWFISGLLAFLNKYSKPAAAKTPPNPSSVVASDFIENDDVDSFPAALSLRAPPGAPAAPLPSTIIHDRVIIRGDKVYRVGDILDNQRIVDVSARKGIEYEDPVLYYDRLNDLFIECLQVRRTFETSSR